MKIRLLCAVLIISWILMPSYLFAQEEGGGTEVTKALLDRIEKLERRIDELNRKVQAYEGAKPKEGAVTEAMVEKKIDEALAKEAEKRVALPYALKDISVSGYIDTSYAYNFNGPDSRMNAARVFDTEAHNFSLHAAEVVLEKATPSEGGVGFRTDLFFGQDAEVITPTGSTRDQFDLQQAYISLKPPLNFNLPIGEWEWIKVGKFVTMHGAEVIESKDNMNFTRSLLFGYAIPFTHTGLRMGYKYLDGVSGYLGISNGWDNVKDNNKGKSVEAAVMLMPSEKLSFSLAGMLGPETTSNNHSQRGLIDGLLTYKPFDKWTFVLNADYGHDEDAVAAGKDGSWWGLAGYAKYDHKPWLSFITRSEYFDDVNGLRITSGTTQNIWEITQTIDVRPYENFITRLEYRHDDSSSRIFTKNQKAIKHQDTLGVECMYLF